MTLTRRLAPAVPRIQWLAVVVMLALLGWVASEELPDFASRHMWLRGSLLVAALGICFAFDDPAAPTTDPVPSPLRKRRGIRVLWGLLPWSLAVAGLLVVGASGMEVHFELPADPQPHQFPLGRLLLEGTTLAVTGLAIAAVIAKFWDNEPGKLAAPTLLALYAASWALPEQWGLWARPSDLWWTTIRPWWAPLLLGALVTVVFSWDSRLGGATKGLNASHLGTTSRGEADSDAVRIPRR